jgi:hypothetical protein
MPAHRTTMRRIKEVLRLKWACNLTHRQVQGALGVGLETITQYLQLATEAGLDWAGAEPREQDKLERRTCRRLRRQRRRSGSSWIAT